MGVQMYEKIDNSLTQLNNLMKEQKYMTLTEGMSLLNINRDLMNRIFGLFEKKSEGNCLFIPGKAPFPSALVSLSDKEKIFIEALKANLHEIDEFGLPKNLDSAIIKYLKEKHNHDIDGKDLMFMIQKFIRKYRPDAKVPARL